jgi:hypothetical protein
MMQFRCAVFARSCVVALLGIGALCGAAGNAAAGAPSAADLKMTKPIDISTFKGTPLVLQDKATQTVVVVFRQEESPFLNTFAGTRRLLFEQEQIGFTMDGATWNTVTWAPRSRFRAQANVEAKDSGFSLTCAANDVFELTLLPPADAQAVLTKAEFRSTAILRVPAALARDETGTYYFVDQLRVRFGGEGYRVFVGKRGKMKQLPLVDLAIDDAGMVFATKSGELRLTIDAGKDRSATWNVKAKSKVLKWLDPDTASYLIHRELGIYTGFGTLCDDR